MNSASRQLHPDLHEEQWQRHRRASSCSTQRLLIAAVTLALALIVALLLAVDSAMLARVQQLCPTDIAAMHNQSTSAAAAVDDAWRFDGMLCGFGGDRTARSSLIRCNEPLRSDPEPPSPHDIVAPFAAALGAELAARIVRSLDEAIHPKSTLYVSPRDPSRYALAHPIAFGIASDLIAAPFGHAREPEFYTNRTPFAELLPQFSGAYKFNRGQHRDMMAEYERALFAVTSRKAGWDCGRHYEILAAGSVPWFLGLENAPEWAVPFLPRVPVLAAMNVPGLHVNWSDNAKEYDFLNQTGYQMPILNPPIVVDVELLPMERLAALAAILHRFTYHYLSTRAMARYVLAQTGVHRNASRVLFLQLSTDSMMSLLLHGFKRLTRARGGYTVESPCAEAMYAFNSTPHNLGAANFRNNGFAYAGFLTEEDYTNRDNLIARVAAREFDVVVFGRGFEEAREHGEPRLLLTDAVYKHYEQSELIFIDGRDLLANCLQDSRFFWGSQPMGGRLAWGDQPAVLHESHLFVREPYDGAGDGSPKECSRWNRTTHTRFERHRPAKTPAEAELLARQHERYAREIVARLPPKSAWNPPAIAEPLELPFENDETFKAIQREWQEQQQQQQQQQQR
jgi:hypothetical protein